MSIESFKHKKDKRTFIPSKEEAGTESANPKAKQGVAMYPKNPVVHRGQDPELFWMNKYGSDDKEDKFSVDIRSLYRTEHISPEVLIKNFYNLSKNDLDKEQLDMFSSFGNEIMKDELAKVSEYYKHQNDWSNRLILGDSLLVMNSLLEREGMAGKIQMVYDPPYGIKYGSNWQMKLNNRNVKDGSDEALSGEPEQIKAYRDTWELGIHSYLSYIRDRLIVAKDLLTESGSCFVQISDENVHLVRNIMDEVFGSENFVNQIVFKKKSGLTSARIESSYDVLLWYAKEVDKLKFRKLFEMKEVGIGETTGSRYDQIESPDGFIRRPLTYEERKNPNLIPKDWKPYKLSNPCSIGTIDKVDEPLIFENRSYFPPKGRHWATKLEGMYNLIKKGRIVTTGRNLAYVLYLEDYPAIPITNIWPDLLMRTEKDYVVQTSNKVIERCILMTTDPGDLVLDPTCGSGTTAFVAEQWGRRWITIDTSRIALNIAKTRLMTAIYPYYKLHDENDKDIRQGFLYKKIPHITLKSLANNEPADEETLFDQPFTDAKKLRVNGPFTVETLQNYDPVSPEDLDKYYDKDDNFVETIFEHLITAGVKNGIKDEHAVFTRVEQLSSPYLNAEGFYMTKKGESKAYFHIGPKFGTVSKLSVNEAIKECRQKGDADWLIILGFSFESDIDNKSETRSLGTFEVTKARMHDDLMQEGLLKKDKKAASFVTIGEPDIILIDLSTGDLNGKDKGKNKKEIYRKSKEENKKVVVEIKGLDIYDPIKDEVKSRDINDIAYWMLDDDYDGSNFMVKQVFFCGGEKDEYEKMKRNLEKLQKTLKIEIDEEAFERVYSHKSHPIEVKRSDQKIAVKVVSQFGEESMKVMGV